MARIDGELKKAQFERVSSDPVTNLVDGRIILNTTEQKVKWYNAAAGVWTQMGVGGNSIIDVVPTWEKIDCTNSPRAVALSKKDVLSIPSGKYLDINEGSGDVAVQVNLSYNDYFPCDLSTTADTHDLAYIIQTALNDNVTLTYTYQVVFDHSSRKFTISSVSGNFSIKHLTGANSANALGGYLGFDVSADDSGASSYTADNIINSSSGYVAKTYASLCDADYAYKSSNYSGFVIASTNKKAFCEIYHNSQIEFSNILEGEKYYTASGAITISASNEDIDFSENGGVSHLTCTLTHGKYLYGTDNEQGYPTLCNEIKAKMDAAGGTYTVKYDKSLSKFIVTKSSGNFRFEFGTGSNVATSAAITLGWTATDTADANSLTSVNAVVNLGSIATASNAEDSSVFVGIGLNDALLAKQSYTESDYSEVYGAQNDLFTTPITYDYGADFQLADSCMNDNGYGMQIFYSPVASAPSYIKIRYTKDNGLTWTTSSSTSLTFGSNYLSVNYNSGANIRFKPVCGIDENNHGVIAYPAWDGSEWDAYIGYSTDLDTWTSVAVETGASNITQVQLAVRNSKAVIAMYYTPYRTAVLSQSTNFGSGYSSWSAYADTSVSVFYEAKSSLHIQYFPEQTGVNKHRIILVSSEYGGGYHTFINYWKGDLSSRQSLDTTTSHHIANAIQDSFGNKNRLVFLLSHYGLTDIKAIYTNDDYNSGTLTISAAVSMGSGTSISGYIGSSSETYYNSLWNHYRSGVLLNKSAYFFVEDDSNTSGKRAIRMYRSNDVTTGTWQTSQVVSNTGSVECVQVACGYTPSSNSIFIAWKEDSAVANAFTGGSIYFRSARVNSDGSLSWQDPVRIDADYSGTFQGWLLSASNKMGSIISWQRALVDRNRLMSTRLQ